MAEQKQTADVDFLTKAENFYEQNKKMLTVAGSGLLVALIAFIGFKSFYLPSKEKEAQEQMFHAQLNFEQDSFRLALHGDGNFDGFLTIANDYSFTKAACLSHYYAGICFLRMGEYDNAITHLKKYSGDDPVVEAMALGALGDAYSEKNNMDDAIAHYKKAANEVKNELVTPYYLFKAGLALKAQGKNADALKFFQQIKNEYPESTEGREIDKYIAMVN